MSSPKIPNPADAAVGGMKADLANYPANWIVNSLAQTGGTGTYGGKTYDFTGLGNADQQSAMSDQMAKALLDIQKNYGADYVKQRLADLQQSDPTGYAARKQLFDKILADTQSAAPNAKLSSDLQTQVNGMLQNAGKLDDQARQQVTNSVRGRQAARGITLGNAPASEEASAVVNAQDALRTQQQQQAQSYLAAGISPEDIQFRKIQQDLSNLGAFSNSQTPEAQFGQVAGAGNGAAPFSPTNYQTPQTISPQNGAQTGINWANQNYQTSQNTANPWLTGINLGISGLNTATNMGLFRNSNPAPAGTVTSPTSSYAPGTPAAVGAQYGGINP